MLVLASTSPIRAQLLTQAGVQFETLGARVDEEAIRDSLLVDGAKARDIADALAEAKARKVGDKRHDSLVLGCDQVLDCEGTLLEKPRDPNDLVHQLRLLSGKRHHLHTAAVIYQDGKPLWRHVATVRMHVHALSDGFIAGYAERNWDQVRGCVGGYKLEGEGVRLFSKIDGDYFAVLGLPLTEVLSYLTLRGDLTI